MENLERAGAVLGDGTESVGSAGKSGTAAIRCRNIVLTGFMGSGKTTVGGILADRLGRRFVDTDRMIEERHGPVPEIVADSGWGVFWAMERDIALELSESSGIVISTGGRMMLDSQCAACLEPGGDVVWLKADPDAIVERIVTAPHADLSKRPLLLEGDRDPHEVVADLLSQRQDMYGRYRYVDTTRLCPNEAADAVLELLCLQNPDA